MKPTLRSGLRNSVTVVVPERFTVPGMLPEVPSWQLMPHVLATPMLVALMEWAAYELLLPHYDDDDLTVGVHVEMTHLAATPPGLSVRVDVTLTAIEGEGRFYDFTARLHDGADVIGEGTHRRALVRRSVFDRRTAKKQARLAERSEASP